MRRLGAEAPSNAQAALMKVVTGGDQPSPFIPISIVVGAIVLLGFSVLTNSSVTVTAPAIGAVLLIAVGHRTVLSWRWLLGLICLVILFIPIRRYTLPASLPFNLEPYRVLVAFVAVGWLTALLIDPRVRLRRTGLDGPLMCFLFVVLIGLVVNYVRVGTVSGEVYKKLAFFASFFILLYLISSVLRHAREIELIVNLLIVGGAILAIFAVIERRTGYNLFNHLQTVIPFLHLNTANVPRPLPGRFRVFASAQHAIALGAAFAMLFSLAVYRARANRQWLWWLVALLLGMGALVTGSRTAVVMLVVECVVFIWLRAQEMKRFWPLLIPALLLVHFAAPGALGGVRASFFPKGGLINEQQNAGIGSGRLATLGPALNSEFHNPLVGEGFGTRVVLDTELAKKNAPILDDEWLGVLLETGVLGALSLVWTFLRFIRRCGREAKEDHSPRGWLLTSLTASVASFAVGMFFYDAFSFIQVTFLLFILLGLGTSTRLCPAAEWVTVPARTPARPAPLRSAPATP
jgi:O-antigen ligase